MYKNYFKRVFDFSAALVGVTLFSPILLMVTIGLFLANYGQPFFFQTRPGKNEKLFIFKLSEILTNCIIEFYEKNIVKRIQISTFFNVKSFFIYYATP